jgi:hypothetical protein
MLNEEFNLSPDLEWMLQSEQVDVDSLITALATKYYQQIYQLALSSLTYPEEAHRAAQETFIQAIFRKKDYRGEIRVEQWIVALTAGIIQQRKTYLQEHRFLNPNLIRSIQSRQPGETLTGHQIDRAIRKIKAQVRAKRSFKSKRAIFQVLGMIGVTVLAIYLLITISSSGIPGSPLDDSTTQLSTPTSDGAINESTPPARKTPPPAKDPQERSLIAASLPILNMTSTQEEILDRIQSSNQLWSTLWADVEVSFLGPAGYVGPAYSERHQIWIDQDRGGLLVSGPTEGFPDYIEKIFLSGEIRTSRMGLFGTSGYSKLGSQYPWFTTKTESVFLFPFAINYLFESINQELQQEIDFSTAGEMDWAGWNTVIVDLTSQEGILLGRLWLEAQRGIVLREQYLDPSSSGKVIIESSVTRINFDSSMPTMWMRPNKPTPPPGGDSQESANQSKPSGYDKIDQLPLGFQYRTAPGNFNPFQSWLSFFKVDPMDSNNEGLGTYFLFADNYFLGEIESIDPLQMICDRSPDGSRITFSDWQILPTDVNDKIYWFDLQDLSLSSLRTPDTNIFRLSFSPDNRTLIAAGYDGLDGQDRFFLVDTDTGEYEQLSIPAGFGSVDWSPDGDQFAILDWSILPFGPKSISTTRVYDAQNGNKITEVATDAIPTGTTTVKIPLDGWKAEFHLPLQDLTHCTSPP